MARKLPITTLLAFAVLGCTSFPDVNQDPTKNNKPTFQRDAQDCAQAYPETSSGAHVRRRIDCMKLKGWY